MAQKRMFDRAIIETDAFLNISMSAKALYFLLGMESDDEGFVSPTRVLRLYGGEMGDIKNLVDVGLVIRFQSGVLVVTNWNQNNYLDKNRIKPTQYQEEKKILMLTERGKYELNIGLTGVQPEERRGVERRAVEKRVTSPPASTPEDGAFNQFWEKYPKKVKKKEAQKAWKKLSPSKELLSEILTAVAAQSKTEEWRKEAGQFVPHPSSWLNGARWQDEAPKVVPRFIQLPN